MTIRRGDVNKQKSPAENRGAFDSGYRERGCSVLGRPGSDLLFQALRLSTIGAEDFDGRVRDGIGYGLLAMTTRSAKDGTGIRDQKVRDQHSERIAGRDVEP
jgi:hypothetical protein